MNLKNNTSTAQAITFLLPMEKCQVQSILEGRKTMTRRIIKSRHESGLFQICKRVTDGQIINIESLDWDERNCEKDITPKYKFGDILWVRESWRIRHWDFEEGEYTVEYKDGVKQICQLREDGDEWLLKTWEKALSKDYLAPSENDEEAFVFTDIKQPFSPSIHMPFEAARIFLEVTNVRCEQLQDISEEDAIAEGIERDPEGGFKSYEIIHSGKHKGPPHPHSVLANKSAIISFRELWESINGPGSWEANPWVFVYEFKRLVKPLNINADTLAAKAT